MTRPEIVTKLLAGLAHRTSRVASLRKPSMEALVADENALDLVSFNLMLAVQAACDIATHVIAEERFRPASSLAESFERLAEEGVISRTTAARLAQAAGFRNVVAHAYHRVNPTAVYMASTTGLDDLDAFAREVSQWLISQAASAPGHERTRDKS